MPLAFLLSTNEELDQGVNPQEEEQEAAEYEALFDPHCSGPLYILDLDKAEHQFKAVHRSMSAEVAELLLQEYPLWPAIW